RSALGLSLELRELRLQRFELLARTAQDPRLDIEFLTRDEIHARQRRLEHGLEVLLEIAADVREALRHGSRELTRQIIDEPWIHGLARRTTKVGGTVETAPKPGKSRLPRRRMPRFVTARAPR